MRIPDRRYRQIAVQQCWMLQPICDAAELEFIRSDAKHHLRPYRIPTAGATLQVEPASVRNEPRFDPRVRRAKDDGIVTKIRMHIPRRRQQILEELIRSAIRLS